MEVLGHLLGQPEPGEDELGLLELAPLEQEVGDEHGAVQDVAGVPCSRLNSSPSRSVRLGRAQVAVLGQEPAAEAEQPGDVQQVAAPSGGRQRAS